MRFSITEVFLIFSILTLCFVLYESYSDLKYAKETINIQDEAILKQNLLIDHQKRYINFLETYEQNTYAPVHRLPL